MIGGYVYRGARVPAARGRYFLGDLCSGVVWSFKVGKKGRASRVTPMPVHVPSLTSFGEDGNGELYAVGLGTIYALRLTARAAGKAGAGAGRAAAPSPHPRLPHPQRHAP
jgi:hypothetical protein